MPRGLKLPRKVFVVLSPKGQRASYNCPGCGRRHSHRWRGDGFYLPECPPGEGYWLSDAGVPLVAEARHQR